MNIEHIQIHQTTSGYFAEMQLTVIKDGEAIKYYSKILNKNTKRKFARNTYKYLIRCVLAIVFKILEIKIRGALAYFFSELKRHSNNSKVLYHIFGIYGRDRFTVFFLNIEKRLYSYT